MIDWEKLEIEWEPFDHSFGSLTPGMLAKSKFDPGKIYLIGDYLEHGATGDNFGIYPDFIAKIPGLPYRENN